MHADKWIRGPIGTDADRRVTRTGCRTVLVMMPTMTAGTRLLDLVPLLVGDHRVQVVFTVPETTETWHGIHEFAHQHGRLVVPWQQAVQHRFDLALAAARAELERVRGPLLVVPHGATSLMSRKFSRSGGPAAHPHTGLARETLISRGRVIPTVLALTHDSELGALRRSCPEALPNAVVAGDICYDRMIASERLRATYRRSLGVGADQRLVMVSSTWSPDSTFGRHPDLCHRLLTELSSSDHRVAVVLHPSVWAVHGRGQIYAWLARSVGDGLLVIPPEEGWRATAIASDWVIGDHGSTTQYATAIGKPVVFATFPGRAIRAGSLADTIRSEVPILDLRRPILGQLEAAERNSRGGRRIAELLTSRPGRSAAILRSAMYDTLGLAEPAARAEALPLPPPHPILPFGDHHAWHA